MRTRLALLSLALAACKHHDAPPAQAPRGPDVQPVYQSSGPPDPLAVRFCHALRGLADERRKACCHADTSVVADRVTSECEHDVTAALGAHAVTLEVAQLAACETAMQAALGGCDWVGPWPPPVPQACDGLLHGTVGKGERCRSSLECQGALRCRDAGPTAPGTCAPAAETGTGCGLAVDALAAFARQDEVERTHPECDGFCERHRCRARQPLGQECVSPSQCGPDRHCAAGKCVDGAHARRGEACTGGGCDAGDRCHQGKCITPAAAGASCASDFECRGACNKASGAATGTCAVACSRS